MASNFDFVYVGRRGVPAADALSREGEVVSRQIGASGGTALRQPLILGMGRPRLHSFLVINFVLHH